ncbi:MAG TPA: GNAT family protein [Gaiellaceae bacterium]|nr:GNAT family protein [Gaiellaceae bacterium]
MPRRLSRPDPPLADDAIQLEPLSRSLEPELAWVVAGDPEIRRFTLLPSTPGPSFVADWLGRYEDGWESGACAGFAIRDAAGDGRVLGFAAIVTLHLDRHEGEIGYLLAPEARGRGAATRAVSLLTAWGFGPLGLERLELRIDTENESSIRVAERAGYRLDGVLRSLHFKEGGRADTGVWSRLSHD